MSLETLLQSEWETILLTAHDQVLNITLNRPKARNAMNLKMVEELSRIFDQMQNTSIRAVIVKGSQGHFCAGGDIKDMASARAESAKHQRNNASLEESPFYQLNRAFGRLLTQVQCAPAVVVVVTEGAVLGGGFGLACVSDVAITLASAKFGLPETSIGIPPAQIAPFVVRRIGLTQTRRLALLGEKFTGKEACELGIVHYVESDEATLQSRLDHVLERIRQCAPQANAITKQLLLETTENDLETVLDSGAVHFSRAVQGAEGQEGAMAFMQKRQPSWATRNQ